MTSVDSRVLLKGGFRFAVVCFVPVVLVAVVFVIGFIVVDTVLSALLARVDVSFSTGGGV